MMVYDANAIISVVINAPTWRHLACDENANLEGLDISADVLDDIKETPHIIEFATKQRVAQRFNIKVSQRGFHEGDLVVKRVSDPTKRGRLAPNWE